MAGVTLDAGALIALDRGDRHIGLVLRRHVDVEARVTIPAPVLAQSVRDPRRQARLMRLVRQDATDVIPLDDADAVSVGQMLAASGTSDVTDAHVVICARRAGQVIVTSDPDDLRALDPGARLMHI